MIKIYKNKKLKKEIRVSGYGYENAKKVRAFHQTFEEYSQTPLRKIKFKDGEKYISALYVKDESYRFGLNAFKVLGGSYAIGSIIENFSEAPVFITATDGNHGRGVAWTAKKLNCKSVVYMPKGTAKERLDNIRKLGSDAIITDLCYDDAVRKAKEDAEKNGWVLVQDTSMPGYEDIPKRIMQGYTTMALEAVEQLEGQRPTHVFLQAGVGSMAGAVTAFLTDYYKENKPTIIIVEPNTADCVFRTAEADDGELHAVDGEMNTIMAGLACGEVCSIAWDILSDYAEYFVTMTDDYAELGMRFLAEHNIISGESGAASAGLLMGLLTRPELENIKNAIGLDENSVVLCFSTEGDTDRESYEKIVGNKEK